MSDKRYLIGGTFEEPTILDTKTRNEYPSDDYSLLDLVNGQDEKINELESELNYIKYLISNAIVHQKTELEKKALQSIIEDYNKWVLGHIEIKGDSDD